MVPHGPDAIAHAKASGAELVPERYAATLAFMFESRYPLRPSAFALDCPELQDDYARCWDGLGSHFTG